MKKTIYVPQYTNTAHSQGRPLHTSATSYVSPSVDLYESNSSMVSKTDLIPTKNSSISVCTILLTVFGGLVLALAITAIVVSILLNSNTTSSNCSVIDSTTTISSTIVTTIVTTGTTPTCSNFTVSINWNYPGNDLANVSPMTIDICCAWCLSLGNSCPGYVYTVSASKCWIKSSITGSGSTAANTISAIR